MTTRKTEPHFEPFADDSAVRNLGGLSFENGRDRIGLHGSLDLTRDKAGLALARELKRTAAAIVAALESADLPEAVAEPEGEAPQRVRNPFA
ncbi:hypothetical protein [Methylobacterium dankookense]|uniref:Uncharacterized protein n=1 Tax=Methylobacterium dankookense TaxID=560405 RepID=A0A564G7V2_9HYPH|nr:hypothetical protein [Methylobacterium dankookense]GJD59652.1 hypothetical protein IFDJLNFL_5582 [Methylobacterium dankookense]VUF16008.1 hypothetical protein MTDSW087_05757 [Methylobacterium dankookense]